MPMIKHMVLLRAKPEATQEQISPAFRELAGLKDLIPGLMDFAGGPYSSPEGLNAGYTHGFVMTFESAASRDVYLPHPEHERVKAIVRPLVDSVIAFDFEL
jgi:stress responsive alpha/beta barrel protein